MPLLRSDGRGQTLERADADVPHRDRRHDVLLSAWNDGPRRIRASPDAVGGEAEDICLTSYPCRRVPFDMHCCLLAEHT